MDLDSILDNALDEYDNNAELQNDKKEPVIAETDHSHDYEKFKKIIEELAPNLGPGGDIPEEELNKIYESTFRATQNGEIKSASDTSPLSDVQSTGKPINIDEAVKLIAEGPKQGPSPENTSDMADAEEMMRNMMKTIGEGGAEGGAFDGVLEELMGNMFTKENLEGPITDIISKYPQWLNENKHKLSAAELSNYSKQYQCFQRMGRMLEADKVDSTGLMDIMAEMQSYGDPPPEIAGNLLPPGFDGAGGDKLPPMSKEDEEAMKKLATECPVQ